MDFEEIQLKTSNRDLTRGVSALEQPPTVSVIMPVKNVEGWISEALASVLSQSLEELELIVVDDGSTDATMDIVRAAQATDDRIKLMWTRGTGGASARNLGISIASGDFLAFADGDDIVPEHAYRALVDQALMSGSAMVVGSHLVFEPQRLNDRQSSLPIYEETKVAITLADEPRFLRDRVCWNRIIRRSSWNQLGLSFIESPRSNDITAMVHAYCALPFDVIPTPVYVYRRRVGDTSMTASKLQPRSVSAHLSQEELCRQAVSQLKDDEILRTYFEGILKHDLWAHGAHLYAEPAFDDDRFDAARGQFRDLVALAPHEAFQALTEEQRLVYAFVRAEKAHFAAAVLARKHAATLRRYLLGAPLSALVAGAHQESERVNGILTEVFRSVARLLTEPEQRNLLDDNQLESILFELRDAKSAGIPRTRLSAHELALVGGDELWSAETIRALHPGEFSGPKNRKPASLRFRPTATNQTVYRALRRLRSLGGRAMRAAGVRKRPL